MVFFISEVGWFYVAATSVYSSRKSCFCMLFAVVLNKTMSCNFWVFDRLCVKMPRWAWENERTRLVLLCMLVRGRLFGMDARPFLFLFSSVPFLFKMPKPSEFLEREREVCCCYHCPSKWQKILHESCCLVCQAWLWNVVRSSIECLDSSPQMQVRWEAFGSWEFLDRNCNMPRSVPMNEFCWFFLLCQPNSPQNDRK